MEILVLKYNDLSKAVKNIQTALNSYKHPSMFSQKDHEAILLESLIKRFELLYELFWKYSQMIVRDVHGLVAQAIAKSIEPFILLITSLVDRLAPEKVIEDL